jgi:hypothetical protein
MDGYSEEMKATCGAKYGKAKNKEAFFKKWRSFQMSGHSPLWVELRIDFSILSSR